MSSTTLRSALGWMLALSLSGCGVAVVTTAQESFAAGDCIGVSVANEGHRSLHYEHCELVLERLQAKGWSRSTYGPNEYYDRIACLRDYRVLEPGGRSAFSHRLPFHLRSGTYRVVVGLSWNDPGEGPAFEERSPEFSVEGPASEEERETDHEPCVAPSDGFDP